MSGFVQTDRSPKKVPVCEQALRDGTGAVAAVDSDVDLAVATGRQPGGAAATLASGVSGTADAGHGGDDPAPAPMGAASGVPRFLCGRPVQRDREPGAPAALAPAPTEAAYQGDCPTRAGGRANDGSVRAGVLPRFLHSPRAIQREDEPGEADASALTLPRFELTPPSLLQPRDPYARYMPGFSERLRLSPTTQAMLATRLAPARVAAQVAALASGGAAPGPVPTPYGQVPAPDVDGPAAAPPLTPPPLAPPPVADAGEGTAPGAAPAAGPPRSASSGDVIRAAMSLQPVSALFASIQQDFVSGLSREWEGADAGGRFMFVASTAVVSTTMLAPLLGFRESRDFVLPLVSNRVIPVPGLPGYGVEFAFSEQQLMIGAHLDVGLLLPAFLGFGPTSLSPFGNPYQPPPMPPPIDRDAEPATSVEGLDSALPQRLDAERGRGRRIDKHLALHMGRALGTDLKGVRVHDDASADTLARKLHARAFTTGQDVFFRSGRYRPQSAEGRELLAHELTHVAQQARGQVAGRPLAAGALSLSDPSDSHEQEAKRLGGELARAAYPRGSVRARVPKQQGAGLIQRQEEEGEEIVAPSESTDKRYDLTLSSGARKGLTQREAIAALREVYDATYLQYDLASGAHRELKKSRDDSVLIGVGGWLTDLAGDDLPTLSIWKDARSHLRTARYAFVAGNVEGAAAALSSAHKAYADAARTYNDYLGQLESSANWATAGVVVVAVLAVVAVVAASGVGAGAAVAGATETAAGSATGSAVSGTATTVAAGTEVAAGGTAVSGTATTVAATEAATGTAAGVGTASAAGTEITSGAVLEVIETVAGNMGNAQALHPYLMRLAASPAGRALLLASARTAVALSQQPGVTQREFQLLKQVSELLFSFARGGG